MSIAEQQPMFVTWQPGQKKEDSQHHRTAGQDTVVEAALNL